MNAPPALQGLLETVVYCTNETEEATRAFYEDVMGLRRLGRGSFAHRVGAQGHVFLLFNTDASSIQESPPPHGARGSVHTCFLSTPSDYAAWKTFLGERDIPIVEELTWPGGVRSFYFSDPAGNLLEIADGDMWPH